MVNIIMFSVCIYIYIYIYIYIKCETFDKILDESAKEGRDFEREGTRRISIFFFPMNNHV